MNPRVAKVGPKTPLAEILQLMLRSHLNDVVVVDRKDRLLGIVTYGDLSRRLLPTQQELVDHEEYLIDPGLMEDRVVDIANVPVEEIMTKKVTTVPPEFHAIKAGALMTARHVKQLPVVQGDKLVGMISHTDIGWGLMMRYGLYVTRKPAGTSTRKPVALSESFGRPRYSRRSQPDDARARREATCRGNRPAIPTGLAASSTRAAMADPTRG
jgi:CBS domain-containing protein